MKITVLCGIVCLFFAELNAQSPANDNCENADEILIGNQGFDFGTYYSKTYDIGLSTKQRGELCIREIEDNGNCEKTVWYKFYIPTTRNVSIQLSQKDSAIPQIFGAFNVYKFNNCNYRVSDISKDITPLSKFGQSGNTCLSQGWYLVQAGFKAKASGEVWLELTVKAPNISLYDSCHKAYDFGAVSDLTSDWSFSFSCSSVDLNESKAIHDSAFSRSLFVAFTVPANSMENKVSVYLNQGRIKYRLFKDTITLDSVYGNKPFIDDSDAELKLFDDFCTRLTSKDTRYFIQFAGQDNSAFFMRISNRKLTTDLWNTPSTNDRINTYNGYKRSISHRYNCSGLMKNHTCKNRLPDYFVRTYKYFNTTYSDTFSYAGYTIINSVDNGTLKVSSLNKNNNALSNYYALYEGDISSSCNLIPVKSGLSTEFIACIKPGKYTLVTACKKALMSSMDKHNIEQKAVYDNTNFYYPVKPEFTGVLDPVSLPYSSSGSVTFKQTDTVLTIDTLKLYGSFIFREFSLSSRSNVSITENASTQSLRYYLLKGRISQGTCQTIRNYIYSRNFNSTSSYACNALDSGYYTLIHWLDTTGYGENCDRPISQITLEIIRGCKSDTANHPGSAIAVNNLKDVLSSPANKVNLDYLYNLKHCTDCASGFTAPAFGQSKAKIQYPGTRYTYYVFYLGKNCEFRLKYSDFNFELYKGNSIANPGLVKDSANIVSKCGGNVICNLKGGQLYTLVLFNLNNSDPVEIYFTEHLPSSNDFAVKAYDLGHFSSNATKTSPAIPITCHTNGYQLDPCPYQYGEKRCPYSAYGRDVNIPYKDTLNIRRPLYRQNLWYTFTSENAADIKLTITGIPTFKKIRQINVFKYTGPYEADFKTMVSAGFDSTEQSLQFVCSNIQTEPRINTVAFMNAGCSKNRYFVLVEEENQIYDFTRYEYLLKVDYTAKSYPVSGDFCNDPQTTVFSSYGTQNTNLYNVCHTYGQSPFETDTNDLYKTSWFKIQVQNIKSCDLSFRYTGGKDILSYTIFGGNCGSLTKITEVTNMNAYFTLSCMKSGDYFIQVKTLKTSNVNLTFSISCLKSANDNCKPYDFEFPLAQFKLRGACMGDSIHLTNLSSDGTDIRYVWRINDRIFSTEKNPGLTIRSTLVNKGKNTVRLLVTNQKNGHSDSSSYEFTPDTSKYTFRITGPKFSYCPDTSLLKVVTDFPYKINYTWSCLQDKRELDGSSVKVIKASESRTYYVTGISDNCVFKDSFALPNKALQLYRDTAICNSNAGFLLSTHKTDFLIADGILINSDSFLINASGLHTMYYNLDGCLAYDTINVTLDSAYTVINLNDTFGICNQDTLTLTQSKYPLQDPIWNTGETGQTIKVNQTGHYRLTGHINQCHDLNFDVYAEFKTFRLNLLDDSTYCFGDTFRFKSLNFNYTLLRHTPDSNYIVVTQPFMIKISLMAGQCPVSDSAWVYLFRQPSDLETILYCDTGNNDSLKLAGHHAEKYFWPEFNDSSSFVFVKKYGLYKVLRINHKTCMDTLSFEVKYDCLFKVFIPNAFSPTNDTHNDVFKPQISGQFRYYELTVFNRWGEILQVINNDGWDGLYMGMPVQQDVYGYAIKVVDIQGVRHFFSGTFTLLR